MHPVGRPRVLCVALLFSTRPRRCTAPQALGRPNLQLIGSDDLRPDTIRALGNPVIETPHLDRLVRAGASFSRAIALIPHWIPRPERTCRRTGRSDLAPVADLLAFRGGAP